MAAAEAQVRSLAWELPHVTGAAAPPPKKIPAGQIATKLIPDCLIMALFLKISTQIYSTPPLVIYLVILSIPLRKFGPLPRLKFPVPGFPLVLRGRGNSCQANASSHDTFTHSSELFSSFTHESYSLALSSNPVIRAQAQQEAEKNDSVVFTSSLSNWKFRCNAIDPIITHRCSSRQDSCSGRLGQSRCWAGVPAIAHPVGGDILQSQSEKLPFPSLGCSPS